MQKYDLIIIGTGAGGGTLAYALAPSGLRILILERGEFLPKEIENWNPHEVYTVGRYRTPEKWYDKEGNAFAPFTHYWVGGNTKMYGAALLRLREEDFKERQLADGISPAWPIDYPTLEPYYTQAEQLYSVHGERGIDPTESFASAPYPYPAIDPEPDILTWYENIRAVGHQPAPIPLGIRLPQDRKKADEASVPSLFDGYPDPTDAKADSHTVGIKSALEHNNVTIKTGIKVIKLGTDPSGKKVTKVFVEHQGEQMIFESEIVVVSCGAINSAALLLGSANGQHPNGLGNSSGQLGKNLMLHNNGTVIAVTEKPNKAIFQKYFLLSEFYHGAPDYPYPLGAIQLMGKTDPDGLKELLEETFGKDQEYDLDYYSQHTIDFFITAEDLPKAENQVKVQPDGSIQLIYHPSNVNSYQQLRQKLIEVLDAVSERFNYGIKGYMGYKLGISGVSHQSGTCRFGDDPATSVLDLNCKAHDLDNLYVVDTSFFPSCGAVNPSLTAMANALRVAEHLKERMGVQMPLQEALAGEAV